MANAEITSELKTAASEALLSKPTSDQKAEIILDQEASILDRFCSSIKNAEP